MSVESMNLQLGNQLTSMMQIHARLAQMEAVPICGVVPSVIRGAISIVELAGGIAAFTLSGGFFCIPCPTTNTCTTIFGGMQVNGRTHITLGLYGLFESTLNIGTLGCYQSGSAAGCCSEDITSTSLGKNEFDYNSAAAKRLMAVADLL